MAHAQRGRHIFSKSLWTHSNHIFVETRKQIYAHIFCQRETSKLFNQHGFSWHYFQPVDFIVIVISSVSSGLSSSEPSIDHEHQTLVCTLWFQEKLPARILFPSTKIKISWQLTNLAKSKSKQQGKTWKFWYWNF